MNTKSPCGFLLTQTRRAEPGIIITKLLTAEIITTLWISTINIIYLFANASRQLFSVRVVAVDTVRYELWSSVRLA